MVTPTESAQLTDHHEFTVEPRSLKVIRRIVTARVRFWGAAALADDIALCVHELLTNVAQHANSPACALRLQRLDYRIRVVVSDTSSTLPSSVAPTWESECGRGLLVITNLSNAWGAELTATGKNVWIEFDLPNHPKTTSTASHGSA